MNGNMHYQQPNQPNPMNTIGYSGINLRVFVLLAAVFLMLQNMLALIVVTAVAIMLEKNKKLSEIMVTCVMALAALFLVSSVVSLIVQPVSSFGFWVASFDPYGEFIYTVGRGLGNIMVRLNTVVTWATKIAAIVIGIIILGKGTKGTFVAPKFIRNYFE